MFHNYIVHFFDNRSGGTVATVIIVAETIEQANVEGWDWLRKMGLQRASYERIGTLIQLPDGRWVNTDRSMRA